jgi:hypothetical protein
MSEDSAEQPELDAANELGFVALRTIMCGAEDAGTRMVAVQFVVCNALINSGFAEENWGNVLDLLTQNVRLMMQSLSLARHEGTMQ